MLPAQGSQNGRGEHFGEEEKKEKRKEKRKENILFFSFL